VAEGSHLAEAQRHAGAKPKHRRVWSSSQKRGGKECLRRTRERESDSPEGGFLREKLRIEGPGPMKSLNKEGGRKRGGNLRKGRT